MTGRGIPRVERSPLHNFVSTVFCIVTLPIQFAYLVLALVLYLVLRLVTLPWTWYFYSANWGLLSRDRKTTRMYAEQIQTKNLTVNNMLTYMTHEKQHSRHKHLPFYPHKTKTSFCCLPCVGFYYRETEYTYPLLTVLFMEMERAGWKREAVYDLFAEMTNDRVARASLNDVKRRVCRGEIVNRMVRPWIVPLKKLLAWTVMPPNMWTAGPNQAVVDVDMTDTKWILARHTVIRPRDMKTLSALGALNIRLGMWKFVKTEDDLNVQGYWQYIVL